MTKRPQPHRDSNGALSFLTALFSTAGRCVEQGVAAYVLRVCHLYFAGPVSLVQYVWDRWEHAAQDGHEWQHGVRCTTFAYADGTMTVY